MAYVWRTWQLEPVEERGAGSGDREASDNDNDGNDDGDNDDSDDRDKDGGQGAIRDRRPAYELTTKQAEAFERIRMAARDATTTKDNNSNNSGNDDTSELEGHVLDFLLALLDHDIGDNEF